MSIKSRLKNLIHELSLETYKKVSPDSFPAGWDVASDIERICHHQQPKIIFDVGANIGQTGSYFHQKFPQADILCFEPIKETFTQLSQKFANNQRIRCFPIAFGEQPSEKTIILNSNSQQNSLTDALNRPVGENQGQSTDKTEAITIDSLDNFCQAQGIDRIDLLKMDTEGYELQVLAGATNFLEERKIAMILSEVGFRPSDFRHTFFTKIYDQLYQKGFRFNGLYDLSYWSPYPYEGLIYCNALFVNANLIKNRFY